MVGSGDGSHWRAWPMSGFGRGMRELGYETIVWDVRVAAMETGGLDLQLVGPSGQLDDMHSRGEWR